MQPKSPQFQFPEPKPLTKEQLLDRLLDLYYQISQLYHKLKPILEPEIELQKLRVAREYKRKIKLDAERERREQMLDAEYERNMQVKKQKKK